MPVSKPQPVCCSSNIHKSCDFKSTSLDQRVSVGLKNTWAEWNWPIAPAVWVFYGPEKMTAANPLLVCHSMSNYF